MKLNEYIYSKLKEINVLNDPISALTPSDIETWIVEWYGKTFHQPNLGGVDGAAIGKPALPPLWLADWHTHIRPVHEQELCGVDEC